MIVPQKGHAKLDPEERESLEQLFTSGQASVRKLARARILLKADEGWKDDQIVQALDVGRATVERTRKRFVLEGLEIALNGRPRQRTYERKLDGEAEAHLIALACSDPPEGHARWTLRLLAERLVQLDQVEVDTVSYETVRRVLKKTRSNLGSRNSG